MITDIQTIIKQTHWYFYYLQKCILSQSNCNLNSVLKIMPVIIVQGSSWIQSIFSEKNNNENLVFCRNEQHQKLIDENANWKDLFGFVLFHEYVCTLKLK